MSRKIFAGIALGLVPTLALPLAQAQQPAQAVGQQAAHGSQNKQQQIAEWLAADNFVTMEIAKLAKEQAKNDKVKKFAETVCEDHKKATEGIECAKGADVLDETPAAYKDIDTVMEAEKDLVEPVHQLRQIICVKGQE